ncbi:MAG: DUF2141 domain-containing protein [Gammaproteobacteria bacterium]|nr:DUF2141 domain-containing protein [Gammaproteobacteria bacterium]
MATLVVTVTGIESTRGQVAIALFASEADYETQKNAVRRAFVDIQNGQARWELDRVPAGTYALIAYHDENGNREIDMRIFGMPKEPAGVSNDARGLFGPPKFKAASFEVRSPSTEHSLKLR